MSNLWELGRHSSFGAESNGAASRYDYAAPHSQYSQGYSGYGYGAPGHDCEGNRKLGQALPPFRSRSRRWSPRAPAKSFAVQESSGGRAADNKDRDRSKSSNSYSSSSGGGSNTDEIIHFKWARGQKLKDSRYEILQLLGDGTFGRVVLANDSTSQRQVAIKIIRDVKRYAENAQIEADILTDIRNADPNGASRCAMMYDTFMHQGKYFCLVFETLGVSLYDFIKKNDFRGFWVQDIQVFAQQSLKALKFLHERLKLTHTDLKPENILLQNSGPPRPCRFPRDKGGTSGSYYRPQSADIKLIDFGNATYESDHHASIINTRQYRGPEVVLELGWGDRSDIWSMGCILLELYTGELLFATHENLEHLALMERILQPFPSSMLEKSSSAVRAKYLTRRRNGAGPWCLNWPEGAASPSSERHVFSAVKLPQLVLPHHSLLADCVCNMLKADPQLRPSAHDMLLNGSSFLHQSYED